MAHFKTKSLPGLLEPARRRQLFVVGRAMSRALSPGRMMLMTALVDRHFREARLEHRIRFVPSVDETGDDRIDIVEVEGGIPASIRLRRARFGVRRSHHDDGEVRTVEDCGWFDTPDEAAARVIAVLRRAAAR
jgi:hypothetical protein